MAFDDFCLNLIFVSLSVLLLFVSGFVLCFLSDSVLLCGCFACWFVIYFLRKLFYGRFYFFALLNCVLCCVFLFWEAYFLKKCNRRENLHTFLSA